METNGQTSPNPFEGWVTLEEAAEIVGRDKTTVRDWANRGKVRSYMVGKRVRVVSVEEIQRFASTTTGKAGRPKRS